MKVEVVNLGYDATDRDNAFYIGRGSVLGNPWSHKKSKYTVHKVSTRQEAIEKYESWIKERLEDPFSSQSKAVNDCAKKLVEKGVVALGCYCKPLDCHGDVLAPIILKRAEEFKRIFDEMFGE